MVIIATLSIKVPSQDMMHSTSGAWGSTAWGAAHLEQAASAWILYFSIFAIFSNRETWNTCFKP